MLYACRKTIQSISSALRLPFSIRDIQGILVDNFPFTIHRYDSSTGQFTVPPGEAGLYFFNINFLTDYYKYSDFRIRVNRADLCRAYTDINTSGVGDRDNPMLEEGNEFTFRNYSMFSTDDKLSYYQSCFKLWLLLSL